MHKISVEKLKKLLDFDKDSGIIKVKKSKRVVLPNPDDGSVVVYDSDTGHKRRLKYLNLAFMLGSGKEIPTDKKVLSFDMSSTNSRFSNLALVDKEVYRAVNVVLRNLQSDMKIIPHKQDVYKCILTYKNWVGQALTVNAVFDDVGHAQKAKADKELEMVKFVNQHILTL